MSAVRAELVEAGGYPNESAGRGGILRLARDEVTAGGQLLAEAVPERSGDPRLEVDREIAAEKSGARGRLRRGAGGR